MQFGGDYGRPRDFRNNFTRQLAKVLEVYPEARVQVHDDGVLLNPSPTHVK